MSPVTPNPAAEFSTFAMTKSSDSRSMSAGTARRAISRPGFPKMSPMNRMRMLGANGDADFLAASVVDPGHRDAKLAGVERRACAAGIEGAVEAYGPCEASERALRQVERRLPMFAHGGHLLSRDHQNVARADDMNRVREHPGHVDHDLDSRFGLDHVEGRAAFRCRHRTVRARPLPDRIEKPLQIVGKITPFNVNPRHGTGF